MNKYANPEKVISRVKRVIKLLDGDISNMRNNELNAGYPILICIFAQIDYLSSIISFDKNEKGRNKEEPSIGFRIGQYQRVYG